MKLWQVLLMLWIIPDLLTGQVLPIDYDYYSRFGHLTVNDGLPGNNVTVIRQDKQGFMWIGTRDGLARYDGNKFHVFRHNPGDSTSIAGNHINDILITADQTIFIGTSRGLSIFCPGTFSFRQVPVIFEAGRGLLDNHVRALLDEEGHYIWVETFNGILHLLNTDSFDARTFAHEKPSQPYYDYHALLKDSRGSLWIGGRNMGPLRMDTAGYIQSMKNDPLDPRKKRDRDVAFFYEDSDEELWIGGLDGLYHYDRAKDIFTKKMHTSSYNMSEGPGKNLWIATGHGLAKLDKKKNTITKYLPADNDLSSLIHDNTNHVTFDRAGNLWIGTDRGISILNPLQNLIRHYRHLSHIPMTLSNNHVSAFLEDRRGNLWIGTRGGGLNLFHKDLQNFKPFTFAGDTKGSISSNQVSALYEDEEGYIWTGLWQGIGFNRFNPGTSTFTHFALDSTSLKKDWYSGFERLGEDTIVVGFWGAEGLRLFDKHGKRWLSHSFRPVNHPSDSPLQCLEVSDSLLWLYTRGNIIHAFNPANETFEAFRNSSFQNRNERLKINSAPLPDFSTIHQIIESRGEMIFLSDKGLIIQDQTREVFLTRDTRTYTAASRNPFGNEIYLLGQDGLAKYDQRTRQTELLSPKQSFPDQTGTIHDILARSSSELLMGTSSGIVTFNIPDRSFTNPDPVFQEINKESPKIRQIVKDKNKNYFIVLERGFALINADGTTEFFNTSNAFNTGFRNDAINHVCISRRQSGVWIGTDRGLYFFSTRDRAFSELLDFQDVAVTDMTNRDQQLFVATSKGLAIIDCNTLDTRFLNHPHDEMLSSHLTTFTKKDSKGHIWVGTTNKGINKINPNTLKISHYFAGNNRFNGDEVLAFLETSDGTIFAGGETLNILVPGSETFEIPAFAKQLPSEKILSITEDHIGRLLIVTSHHITIYERKSEQVLDLTPYLGTENITFTSASLKTSANEILIGSVKGFFLFNPELLAPPSRVKKTLVTSVNVMGEPRETSTLPARGLRLNHEENFLQFFFSDMEYPFLHDTYQYKLEGIDPGWTETDETSATYKMLPPGGYTFNVRAINKFGKSIPARLPVIIRPPFYKSWWFILSILLIVISGLWLWWQHRLRHLQVIESNLYLRHRLLLSQMNPHFIFNALTAIQSFIYQNQPKVAGSYLSKFAKLMRLYLNNMTSTVTPVSKEVETLNHYLELQCLRMNHSFKYNVSVNPLTDIENTGLPSMMVQPFVENAIEHGIRDIEYEGNIEVIFTLKNKNTWAITIRDNGIGIARGHQRKAEEAYTRDSRSTGIARDRIIQLSRQYKQSFFINIQDKTREPAEETGTGIDMELPAINMNNPR